MSRGRGIILYRITRINGCGLGKIEVKNWTRYSISNILCLLSIRNLRRKKNNQFHYFFFKVLYWPTQPSSKKPNISAFPTLYNISDGRWLCFITRRIFICLRQKDRSIIYSKDLLTSDQHYFVAEIVAYFPLVPMTVSWASIKKKKNQDFASWF